MPEYDYIVTNLTVEQEGRFDLQELYAFAKNWILKRQYDLSEKEYKTTQTEKGNLLRIKWWAFKKVDDYTKFNYDILFLGSNLKKLASKDHEIVEGTLFIEIESYIEKDYEEIWGKSPVTQFLREVFDKLFLRGKFGQYETELKEESYAFRDALKRFFNGISY